MDDSRKHLTAFQTHRGQYQWNVLPFGLRNAAATYQRAMSKENKEVENALKELKTALCGITELQIPDIEKPDYLQTDASQTVVGCCLDQLDGEDNIHPIAFGSQKLNPGQQKWSTIEREVYAII
ncbi:retrovirus-related Pol polyprotein from transposon opus [Trichonephila clavipes]|nr:retrovirus-related Pol polyprotein from transposon opus [Trichonephila clavipes]